MQGKNKNRKDNDFTNHHFISEDGYITLKYKVLTEDDLEREKLIGALFKRLHKGIVFNIDDHMTLEKIYFANKGPVSALIDVRAEMNAIMDNLIEENKKE